MSASDITLAQLRALLAVHRQGSITSAAQHLGVTQPVLTRSLRLLEQQTGVDLLKRTARGAALTTYGLALMERAQRIDDEMRRAREELAQLQGEVSGRVALACSPIPMMLFVPEAIGQFRRHFADVEVRVTEAVYPELLEEFRAARIDFAIGPIPERGLGREYKTSRLLDVDLVLAVRKGHQKASAKSIRDFMGEDWMVMGPPKGPGAIVSTVFEQFGLSAPASPLYLQTVWSALEVIRHTDLIGFIPRHLALREAKDIVVVPVREKLPTIRIHAITLKNTLLTPAGRALISAIRASAAGHDGPR
jgi:LysR family transcriptional regulator of abg operon